LHPSKRQYDHPSTIHLDSYSASDAFRIEVKPLLGDDYPAVLRTMKATNCTHLLVDEYCGDGASWDQVVKVFALSKITAVLLEDVENTSMPAVFGGVPVNHMAPEVAKDIGMAAYEAQLKSLAKD
jgi:hypothetical protein